MILLIIIITVCAISFIMPFKINASNFTFNPEYIKIQYAGNLGLVSVGTGKYINNKKATIDFNYGYLPALVHNARVHTFALKSTYQSREISLRTIKSRVYVGAALAYSITRNTYLKMPDKLPLNYYAQNAVHLEPFVGAKVLLPTQNQCLRKWALYSEIGTVDYKLLYKIQNKSIDFCDLWNICFGIWVQFK